MAWEAEMNRLGIAGVLWLVAPGLAIATTLIQDRPGPVGRHHGGRRGRRRPGSVADCAPE